MLALEEDELEDFLTHYGILGMKWGVRKDEIGKNDSKSITPKRKSNRRVNLEGRYIKRGLSIKDAEVKADRRLKVEKSLALVGAISVATLAGYAISKKIGRDFVKVELKKGTTMRHVFHKMNEGEKFVLNNKELFTTFRARDLNDINVLYPRPYMANLVSSTNIKAPSNYEARKIFSKVIGVGKTVSAETYAKFNYGYYYASDPGKKTVADKFFKILKEQGYNALLDPKPGGYGIGRLHQPLIVFDAAKNLTVNGETFVNKTLSDKFKVNFAIRTAAKQLAGLSGMAAGVVAPIPAAISFDRSNAIDKYYKENPGSKLTRSQISAMLKYNPIRGTFGVKT